MPVLSDLEDLFLNWIILLFRALRKCEFCNYIAFYSCLSFCIFSVPLTFTFTLFNNIPLQKLLNDLNTEAELGRSSFCGSTLTPCSFWSSYRSEAGWREPFPNLARWPCEHGREKVQGGVKPAWWECVFISQPEEVKGCWREAATCWVFSLTSVPSARSHPVCQLRGWAPMASSGISLSFLTSPTFLGTQKWIILLG